MESKRFTDFDAFAGPPSYCTGAVSLAIRTASLNHEQIE